MREETPNDLKLSDGGAWRGACPTVARTADAPNVATAPLAESTRRDTRSRSLQRMVRPIGLRSDPCIEGESLPIGLSHEGGDAVVPIEDSICMVIQHEDDRGRDSSGLRAQLVERMIAVVAANHVGKDIVGSVSVACREADRKSTRLNSSHERRSRMPSSA